MRFLGNSSYLAIMVRRDWRFDVSPFLMVEKNVKAILESDTKKALSMEVVFAHAEKLLNSSCFG